MAQFTVYDVEVEVDDDEILDAISIEDFVDHHGSASVSEYLVDNGHRLPVPSVAECIAEHGTSLLCDMDPAVVSNWLIGSRVGAQVGDDLVQAATILASFSSALAQSNHMHQVAKAIGILMERRHLRLTIFDAIFKWGNFNEGA